MHPDRDPALAGIGWDDARRREVEDLCAPHLAPARCVRVDRGSVLVLGADGPRRVRPTEPTATGDWLVLDGSRMVRRLTRRTEIARRAPGPRGGRQVIAANVDLLLIVCGLDRPVRHGRIRRLAALAREGGASARVLLTKADLHHDPPALARAVTAALGLEADAASAVRGEGVGLLRSLAASGRTLALVGESGAGKSTLVNALAEAGRATRAVRAGDAKGRHTTSARELVPLPGGGALIDTPGLREVGLAGAGGLEEVFGDIASVAAACRFRDCRHLTEPGCAVRAAAAAGVIDPAEVARLDAMRREAEAAELRADDHERRRHERRFARVVRQAQGLRREGPR